MKKALLALLTMIVVITCVGCSSKVGVTYEVSTGDSVKVYCNTSSGWKMSTSYPPIFTKGDSEVDSTFIDGDTVTYYLDTYQDAEIYTINDRDWYHLQDVTGDVYMTSVSDATGFMLYGEVGTDIFEECASTLTITVE